VPEGDTIYRTAAALRTALVGRPISGFDAPRLTGPRPEIGRVIERVESHGKHLEIVWDDGIVLHTHMKMTGAWHLYHPGERWRKSRGSARVIIEAETWIAVCFNAPVVETYHELDRHRHPGFGKLGPDLCDPAADLAIAIRRLATYDPAGTPLAEVLLDQRVACGVGNVYKSEVLFACGLHPFVPVGLLPPSERVNVIEMAARLLQANVHTADRITFDDVPGGLGVYGRTGKACFRCGALIVSKRHGEQNRRTYWCPACQFRGAPEVHDEVEHERDWSSDARRDGATDPHPAAVRFMRDIVKGRASTPSGGMRRSRVVVLDEELDRPPADLGDPLLNNANPQPDL
jgi:endonuclease VIII